MAGIDGMPSASSGIMAVPVTALFAVSGPATPAMAPLPNSSRVIGEPLLDGVGHEGRDDMAHTRDDSENEPDDRSTPDRRRGFREILPARHEVPELRRDGLDRFGLFQIDQNLGKAEQADGQGGERQSAGELGAADGEARDPGELVEADGAEREPERNHGGGLDTRAGARPG